ncbi:hypothetical protein [Bradyrhizobium sp. 195]|nr:hypothetical protein IVB26_06340 [Bradyrhizobium sp. 195]
MKEPALDQMPGTRAPNELVLTPYDEQHLLTYWRLLGAEADGANWEEVARIVLLLALQPRFTFRGSNVGAIPESACKEVGFPATIRVDQSSEVVSRDFDLDLWPSSAASRWFFMGGQRTGLWASRALWPARSMSAPLGGQKRGHVRHRGAQDRIKIRNAL